MLSATYTRALTAVGATPLLLPSVAPDHASQAVDRVDALLITGGGDIDPSCYGQDNTSSTDIDAARDAWELALARAARDRGIPLLGICRGCQILNVSLGGTLRQEVWGTDDHRHLWNDDRTRLADGDHDVDLSGTLADIYGKDARRVNSFHHQAIGVLGEGLAVVATARDGSIEAVESTTGWRALAVQWHPERLDLSDEGPLFGWIAGVASDRPDRFRP
jgi:putative glutamine amidotransferase